MELLDREELINRGATLIVVTEETISTIGCPVGEGKGLKNEQAASGELAVATPKAEEGGS